MHGGRTYHHPTTPRLSPTRAAKPGPPTQVEHENKHGGPLNLLGALDTRTGKVWGERVQRKRQVELIALLEQRGRPARRVIGVYLMERLGAFLREWNECAPAFQWTVQSFAKIFAGCEQPTHPACSF